MADNVVGLDTKRQEEAARQKMREALLAICELGGVESAHTAAIVDEVADQAIAMLDRLRPRPAPDLVYAEVPMLGGQPSVALVYADEDGGLWYGNEPITGSLAEAAASLAAKVEGLRVQLGVPVDQACVVSRFDGLELDAQDVGMLGFRLLAAKEYAEEHPCASGHHEALAAALMEAIEWIGDAAFDAFGEDVVERYMRGVEETADAMEECGDSTKH